jgi:Ricin-type beta-trefoil lectin domain-like
MIDTADVHAGGETEEIVDKAPHGRHDEVELARGRPPPDHRMLAGQEVPGLTRCQIRFSWSRKLAAMEASPVISVASRQVAYTGSWGHASGEPGPYGGTNSYTDVAGNTATLSFVGTGVTLHAVTDPGHGIVGGSVDGGAETLIDEYSPVRTGDVAVWTSPRLAAGTHTVRVRVTGNQRAGATHNWATVDRFEITTGPSAGTSYRIVSRNSGKLLVVAGNSTADGAGVVQQAGAGPWTVDTAAGGTYTLRYMPTGKVLDVNGGSTAVGLQLQQRSANGGTNQQWQLVPA